MVLPQWNGRTRVIPIHLVATMGGIEDASFKFGFGAGLMTLGLIGFISMQLSALVIGQMVVAMILGAVWMAWGAEKMGRNRKV